eukprot:SM000053S17465  [mRNA]  locus=s53:545738:548036:- [translate_table: standard]
MAAAAAAAAPPAEELSVSFEYQCRSSCALPDDDDAAGAAASPSSSSVAGLDWGGHSPSEEGSVRSRRSGSFHCLAGAAMGANATLANTTLAGGLIGGVVLPGLDSPRTFRRVESAGGSLSLASSSGSAGSSDLSSSASGSLASSAGGGLGSLSPPSSGSFNSGGGGGSESSTKVAAVAGAAAAAPDLLARSRSGSMVVLPEGSSGLLPAAPELQVAGGAAGEDRVQAVCSEEDGWLFCGIYDGFNGRDAADFLAANLYERIGQQLRLLDWQLAHDASAFAATDHDCSRPITHMLLPDVPEHGVAEAEAARPPSEAAVREAVMGRMVGALAATEADFLEMVEQEMDDRPDLAMVGSCVLAVLVQGDDLFALNVGDSRAVLATRRPGAGGSSDTPLVATALTEVHTVDSEPERERVMAEHPDDPTAIVGTRVKGKLRLTRAFGAGYLKSAHFNDGLMGILRVRGLDSPPYVSSAPSVRAHRVTPADAFVVLGSDGLFDFFTDQQVVDHVAAFTAAHPHGDPARHMLEQLLVRAAEHASMTVEQLKAVPIGRRRKYHDDVTIVVLSLGGGPSTLRTSSASTLL